MLHHDHHIVLIPTNNIQKQVLNRFSTVKSVIFESRLSSSDVVLFLKHVKRKTDCFILLPFFMGEVKKYLKTALAQRKPTIVLYTHHLGAIPREFMFTFNTMVLTGYSSWGLYEQHITCGPILSVFNRSGHHIFNEKTMSEIRNCLEHYGEAHVRYNIRDLNPSVDPRYFYHLPESESHSVLELKRNKDA